MTTLYRAYTSTHEAEDAIERLLAAGVPEADIQLIMGVAIKDARDKPIGTWAGTTTPDALTVGSYANVVRSGRAAMGTFAGDPDKQRRGAFSDVDRDTVTTYQSGVKRTRIASHRRLEKLLVDAGLDQAIATTDVGALHTGRVLVLVQSESALDDIAAAINNLDPGLRDAA
jgi:hypothetical protein